MPVDVIDQGMLGPILKIAQNVTDPSGPIASIRVFIGGFIGPVRQALGGWKGWTISAQLKLEGVGVQRMFVTRFDGRVRQWMAQQNQQTFGI